MSFEDRQRRIAEQMSEVEARNSRSRAIETGVENMVEQLERMAGTADMFSAMGTTTLLDNYARDLARDLPELAINSQTPIDRLKEIYRKRYANRLTPEALDRLFGK